MLCLSHTALGPVSFLALARCYCHIMRSREVEWRVSDRTQRQASRLHCRDSLRHRAPDGMAPPSLVFISEPTTPVLHATYEAWFAS
eukprot:419379-Rhodomonas_salina.2